MTIINYFQDVINVYFYSYSLITRMCESDTYFGTSDCIFLFLSIDINRNEPEIFKLYSLENKHRNIIIIFFIFYQSFQLWFKKHKA